MLYDGETQPGPALLPRPSRVHAVETLEDAGQVIGGNTTACIGHADAGRIPDALGDDANAAAARRVPYRVVEQVGEDLSQRLGVAVHGCPISCGFELHVSIVGALHERPPCL